MPGNPKIKVTTFQKVVPVACALIPVKLKFAKIQTAQLPPSLPAELVEDMSIEFATAVNNIKPTPKRHKRLISFLTAMYGLERNELFIIHSILLHGWSQCIDRVR